MGRIEDLADRYAHHIAVPWQRTVSGAQRVIIAVYDKELERTLRARTAAFEHATRQAGYEWQEVDVTNAFALWMASDEYRDAYFESPDDLQLKLESDFPEFVAKQIRKALEDPDVGERSVVSLLGAGALFGLTRVSRVLKLVEPDITKGRLLVFFPGQYDHQNYRLLDARDNWNYLAVPITTHSTGEPA